MNAAMWDGKTLEAERRQHLSDLRRGPVPLGEQKLTAAEYREKALQLLAWADAKDTPWQ